MTRRLRGIVRAGPRVWAALLAAVAVLAGLAFAFSGGSRSEGADTVIGTDSVIGTNPSVAEASMTSGDIDETVAYDEQQLLPRVHVSESVKVDDRVRVRIAGVDRIQTQASAPGEIGGAAIRVTVVLANESAGDVDVSSTTVAVADAAGAPLSPVGSASTQFLGVLSAGGTQTGEYVFTLAPSTTAPAVLSINYAAASPVAIFESEMP